MALTTSQEEVLQEIIAAYQNGKRLADLPDVTGENPFDLYTEVLDTDGESKKAALATLLPYIEDDCSYGIEFDTTVSSPDCTRIGNTALHKSLPIQNRMRGCLLDDSGNVVEYLNPTDWTGNVRDGSRGQVMVEIPMFYVRFITDGTVRRVRMSEYPLPGYRQVPKMYVGAYEAAVQRSTLKLCSVVNTDADYRGGNNNATYDGDDRTFLGRPATAISRTNFRAYARNRGTAGKNGCGWNAYLYQAHKMLFWLFAVEYATLNSQKGYNAELTTEGYKQGGLGAGVSNLTNYASWQEWNGVYPFIPCGYTDSLGNTSGQVAFDMPESYGTLTVQVNRYRGVEMPFAHVWKWSDGVNVEYNPSTEAGGSGLARVFVCDDPSKFSDSGYDGYRYVGDLPHGIDGWVKEFIFGEEGDIIATLAGGSSSTYACDYGYNSGVPTEVTLRGLLFGGTAIYGTAAGFACVHSSSAPSATNAFVASRLCFIPA